MTPDDVVRHTKHTVIRAGAAFGHDPVYRTRGRQLGLTRWPFYFGGRAGVLGDVDADVVAAVCGFFARKLVTEAWSTARALTSLGHIVEADIEECLRWGRNVYDELSGLERLADLLERVVEAADSSGRPLFAAWRSLVVQADDPAARVALALLRLREHRGGSHLIAVLANGHTPLTAILAGPGIGKARANGWAEPWPAVPPSAGVALERAKRLTDDLSAEPYAVLNVKERTELVELLARVDEAYRRFRDS
ncbi:SCO6745 family protein [Streptosporangium sp. G11]|uniref:SCO6745 family protein n=1 Tax=Streptosporangium sp. G11 TaxID=3436926 RepID=UPI003EBE5973